MTFSSQENNLMQLKIIKTHEKIDLLNSFWKTRSYKKMTFSDTI